MTHAELARTAVGIIACFSRGDDDGIEVLLEGFEEDQQIYDLCEMLTALCWGMLEALKEQGVDTDKLLSELALRFAQPDDSA